MTKKPILYKYGKYSTKITSIFYPIAVKKMPKELLDEEHEKIHNIWNATMFKDGVGEIHSSFDYRRWVNNRHALFVRHEQVTQELTSRGYKTTSKLYCADEVVKEKLVWPKMNMSLANFYDYYLWRCARIEFRIIKPKVYDVQLPYGNAYFRQMGKRIDEHDEMMRKRREEEKLKRILRKERKEKGGK